jgi:hypothetical protein
MLTEDKASKIVLNSPTPPTESSSELWRLGQDVPDPSPTASSGGRPPFIRALTRAAPLAVISATSVALADVSRLPHSGFASIGALPTWALFLGVAVITGFGAAILGIAGEAESGVASKRKILPKGQGNLPDR